MQLEGGMADAQCVSGITKKCSRCGEIKPLEAFGKHFSKRDNKHHHSTYCRPCAVSISKESDESAKANGLCVACNNRIDNSRSKCYCLKCLEKLNATSHRRAREIKDAAFNAYGGYSCSCCGIKEQCFLTLDHVNGGGNHHREQIAPNHKRWGGGGGDKLYRWLKREGYPTGFQVLCFNCNFAKWRLGKCPHQS